MKNLNRQSWPALAADLYAAAVLVWMPWYAGGYVQLTQEKLSAFLGVTRAECCLSGFSGQVTFASEHLK